MSGIRPTRVDPRAQQERAAEERVAELGATVYLDIIIPRTQTPAKLRLCKRNETSAARAETRQYLLENGFPVDASAITALGAGEEWQYELAIRTLALAIRDPNNPKRALASVDEWREEADDDQIAALMKMYDDHAARIDPLADGSLSDADLASLVAAAKKKDADSLMAFGSRKLASFAITSANPPAPSVTPTS